MRPRKVKALLGPPDEDTLQSGFGTWIYGTTEIWFIENRVEYLELGQPCIRQDSVDEGLKIPYGVFGAEPPH